MFQGTHSDIHPWIDEPKSPHRDSCSNSSLSWHMASKHGPCPSLREGTREIVQDPSFASGWYENLLKTASGYTHLLHDFFAKPRSRYSKSAGTSSALAPGVMTDDQCTLTMVSSAAKDLVHTVDRLRALHGHGVPPADLRDAHTGPPQVYCFVDFRDFADSKRAPSDVPPFSLRSGLLCLSVSYTVYSVRVCVSG